MILDSLGRGRKNERKKERKKERKEERKKESVIHTVLLCSLSLSFSFSLSLTVNISLFPLTPFHIIKPLSLPSLSLSLILHSMLTSKLKYMEHYILQSNEEFHNGSSIRDTHQVRSLLALNYAPPLSCWLVFFFDL